jgi:threonine synthase
MNVTGLRCVRCEELTPLGEKIYVCPSCGANLQVVYNYDTIKQTWDRDRLTTDPDHTIWRYAPLYPVAGRIKAPPIGWTPLFEAPRLAKALGHKDRLFIKDDGRMPSASFKDRASAIALVRARELGEQLVTGASTGNAASSTAVLAAGMGGIHCRIFIPEAAPKAKVAQLLAFGAEVLAVQGTYDEAFDLCLAATDKFGWYNRNTGFNPFTREGKKSVSFEICEQLGWECPDWVVVPVGDGNIISGVWKGFSELHRIGFIDRLPRLLAVQAAGSDAVVRALEGDGSIAAVSGDTVADSISVSVPRDGEAAVLAVRESEGAGIRVSDEQILAAIKTVARTAGVFGEPAGVTSAAGLGQALTDGAPEIEGTVVLLLTGSGLKDVASVMKVTGKPRSIPADPAVLGELFGDSDD